MRSFSLRQICSIAFLFSLLLSSPRFLIAAEGSHNQLTPDQVSSGWIQLFDGETLFGWKSTGHNNWHVDNGAITADTGPIGALHTTMEFADYEFFCEFQMEKDANSAVFVHSLFNPQDPVKECYEVNLCDNHPKFKTGGIVGLAPPDKFIPGEGGWKSMSLVVKGPLIKVSIGDDEVLNFADKSPTARKSGLLGLQKNVGKVSFRNIRLRPLLTTSLLKGNDLSGWHLVPGGKSKFSIKEGELHVENGRGYLESDNQYGDFILQSEIFSNGKHLNSGIFFRAIAGTEQNPADGYEAQVRNQWDGDDRSKPVDFGTGGIYRRIPTRKVVSSDFEWFTMTVAARGPQFSVWVNGYPVTDWIDTRKPDDNPRKGLRTAAGHLSIQGHDPTTDLRFRNFRIAELPVSESPRKSR